MLSEIAPNEEWPKFNEQLLLLAELRLSNTDKNKQEYKVYLRHCAGAMNNKGFLATNEGNYSKALEYWNKSLKIFEDLGFKKGTASSLHNIAFVYKDQGNITKALEYNEWSLKIRKEIGDKKGISNY